MSFVYKSLKDEVVQISRHENIFLGTLQILAAGTAKGPTPAQASKRTEDFVIILISLSCSVPSLGFQ